MNKELYKNIIFDENELKNFMKDKLKLARNFLQATKTSIETATIDSSKNNFKVLFSGKDEFDLEGRLCLTRSYLQNSFNFLNHDLNHCNLKELINNWNKFRKIYQNQKCHKNKNKFDNINEIFILNETINKLQKFEKDFFLKIFMETFFINLSLIQTDVSLISLKSKKFDSSDLRNIENFSNTNNSDFPDSSFFYNSKIGIDSIENVKWKLITQINEQLTAYLLAITCSEKLFLEIRSFNVIIIYFLSFLREEGFFCENDKKLVSSKKNKIKTIYGFKFKYDILDLPSDFYYLEFCKYEPIIIKNSPLLSPEIKNNTYLLFFDVIFKWQIINRKNPNYKKFNENEKDSPYDDIFDESLIAANSTKFYIFKSQSEKLIKKFIEKNLSNEVDLFWNHSVEDLIKYFKNYSVISGVEIKTFFSNILRLIYLKKWLLMLNNQDFVYITFFIDFRGRKYFNSIISPTNFKLMRLLLHFGTYSKKELNEMLDRNVKSKSFTYLKKFFNEIDKRADSFNLLKKYQYNFDDKNYLKAIISNTLISIGILFKNDLLKIQVNKQKNYEISMDTFFNAGLDKFLNKKTLINNLDWEEKLILERYFMIIDGDCDIYTKIPVPFDFSCSGHQINFLYSIFENVDDYEKINVKGGDKACDTYTYIITIFSEIIKNLYDAPVNNDLFILYKLHPDLSKQNLIKLYEIAKKNNNTDFIKINIEQLIKEYYTLVIHDNFKNKEELLSLLKCFTRSYLKRAIMTTQYNCSLRSFLDYIFASFKSVTDKKYLKNNEFKLKIILKIFYYFCNNFNNFDKLKTLNDKESLKLKMKKKNYRWKFFDGFIVDFAYFKDSNEDLRIVFLTTPESKSGLVKRITTKDINGIKIYCQIGTEISSTPNSTHSLDSSLIRVISLCEYRFYCNNNLFTIHDEYWLPFQNSLYFKDLVNCVIKIKLNHKINFSSIFTLKDLENDESLLIDKRLKGSFNFFVIW